MMPYDEVANIGCPTVRCGVTDETCQNYQAADGVCDVLHRCENCDPDPAVGCSAVQSPAVRVYGVEQHGQVAGEAAMLAEIFARGPIGCGICVTADFEAYTGGIFNAGLPLNTSATPSTTVQTLVTLSLTCRATMVSGIVSRELPIQTWSG